MRSQTVINKLKSIGIKIFSDASSITYHADLERGEIRVDFWNIDQVFINKYGHTDGRLMGITILTKKNSKIHSNTQDHVFRDVVSIDKRRFESLNDTQDLLNLIRDVQSIGLRIN